MRDDQTVAIAQPFWKIGPRQAGDAIRAALAPCMVSDARAKRGHDDEDKF